MRLIPKNWVDFQHYKDRCPPWIKLHKGLLDDSVFQRLPVASRALAPMLWLLASESKDGVFDGSVEELSFRLRQTEKEIAAGLDPLISKGFFMVVQAAIKLPAGCVQVAVPETEAEREERERVEAEAEAAKLRAGTFEQFYEAYPNRSARKTAEAAFLKADIKDLSIVLADIATRCAGVEWRKEGGKYIPMPATYLNQRRWEDERSLILDPVIDRTLNKQEALEASNLAAAQRFANQGDVYETN